MALLQFVVVTALAAFVTWLAGAWNALFENKDLAFVIWMSACILYAFIYDRRQDRKRRAAQDSTTRP